MKTYICDITVCCCCRGSFVVIWAKLFGVLLGILDLPSKLFQASFLLTTTFSQLTFHCWILDPWYLFFPALSSLFTFLKCRSVSVSVLLPLILRRNWRQRSVSKKKLSVARFNLLCFSLLNNPLAFRALLPLFVPRPWLHPWGLRIVLSFSATRENCFLRMSALRMSITCCLWSDPTSPPAQLLRSFHRL